MTKHNKYFKNHITRLSLKNTSYYSEYNETLGVPVATTLFDVADTASVIDSLELTEPTLYANQEFVSVQIKNSGNTGLVGITATLLIEDATSTGATGTPPNVITDCGIGTSPIGIGSSIAALNPGSSVTLSGDFGEPCNPANQIEDRKEYILQVTAFSENEQISKTVTIRAR